jgi:HK97 family phage prohead protease
VTNAIEIRTGKAERVELRASADGGLGVLVGYALKFNTLSRNLGGFVETIAPGAVDKSLADSVRVMARTNHDNNWLLGTSDAGTLRLAVDGTGLLYEIDIPDTSAGRDTRALAERGDLRYSSFAFHTPPNGDEWSLTPEGFPLRTLNALQLVDVAPVNDPAYLDTSTGLRSLAAVTGLDVAALHAAEPATIRSLILGETPQPPAQVDNHAGEASLAAQRNRARVELARQALTL